MVVTLSVPVHGGREPSGCGAVVGAAGSVRAAPGFPTSSSSGEGALAAIPLPVAPLAVPGIPSAPLAVGTEGISTCLHWKLVAALGRERLRNDGALFVIREIPGRR